MNNYDVKLNIGKIGEDLIQSFFDSDKTRDWYDNEKDGNIGKFKYEVKTIRLNESTQSFWIDKSQWTKVHNVDLLFFVRVPIGEENAAAYLCINHKDCFKTIDTKYGTQIRAYPLTSCLKLFNIDNDVSRNLCEMSKQISSYKR